MNKLTTGLGDKFATFRVFIANRPNFQFALQSDDADILPHPVVANEINAVGLACGNGWRKVFNVYAKLIYALPRELFSFQQPYSSWQQYRDEELLRSKSNTALMFTLPTFAKDHIGKEIQVRIASAANEPLQFKRRMPKQTITIIMGRTYAKSMSLPSSLTWLNDEFAIDKKNRIIICPYFDYRQLSNIKICYLVDLIRELA